MLGFLPKVSGYACGPFGNTQRRFFTIFFLFICLIVPEMPLMDATTLVYKLSNIMINSTCFILLILCLHPLIQRLRVAYACHRVVGQYSSSHLGHGQLHVTTKKSENQPASGGLKKSPAYTMRSGVIGHVYSKLLRLLLLEDEIAVSILPHEFTLLEEDHQAQPLPMTQQPATVYGTKSRYAQ
jgi:hypothetical protein